MIDYTSLPYAKWLEEANKALVEINPDAIYFGLIKDGEVVSSYFNFDSQERALIIQEMLTMNVLDRLEDHIDEMIAEIMEDGEYRNNLEMIINGIEDEEDENEEGEDDE